LLSCRLEYNFLTKYTCLTAGETITVTEGDRRYRLDVVEAQPEPAVLVLETDCEVDFATPLDYVEPPPPAARAENNNNEPVRFTGVAKRLDGKPVLEQPKPASPAARGKTKEGGDENKEKKEKRFTGKAYSLR
jgi:ubiquitin fusion degradation protein 1